MAETAMPAADADASDTTSPPRRFVSTTQAAFIGVGAMVGAGIFSLLGAADGHDLCPRRLRPARPEDQLPSAS